MSAGCLEPHLIWALLWERPFSPTLRNQRCLVRMRVTPTYDHMGFTPLWVGRQAAETLRSGSGGERIKAWGCVPFLFLTLAPIRLVTCILWVSGEPAMGREGNEGVEREHQAFTEWLEDGRRRSVYLAPMGRNRGTWLLTVLETSPRPSKILHNSLSSLR